MSIAIRFNNPLILLKQISKELRLLQSKPSMDNPLLKYMLNEYRKHQVTDEQICRANHELQFIGETYLTYLNSSRRLLELRQKYSRGERNVEDAAKTVGLSLPNTNEKL